jgi:hypothetical protein
MQPQPFCVVIILSGQIFLLIFCYSFGVCKKITKIGSDERFNAEMKSLSILCVGGRGQPMLAGGSWGRGMEPKNLK